jgi:flagellum-specific ATP synthase
VQAGQQLRSALAVLREKEDLVAIGAYQPGSDPALDTALSHRSRIERFLRQPVAERSDPLDTDALLLALGSSLAAELAQASGEIPDAEEVSPELPPGGAEEPVAPVIDASGVPAIPALGLRI